MHQPQTPNVRLKEWPYKRHCGAVHSLIHEQNYRRRVLYGDVPATARQVRAFVVRQPRQMRPVKFGVDPPEEILRNG